MEGSRALSGAPRIVIYGVGHYGQFVTRLAAEKGWPIVAAFNRAGAKVGQDLGRLAGLGRDLGVVVQDCDQADFGALEADVGVVTMTNVLRANMPAYERLMGAGLDVLCHGSQSYYPWGCDPDTAAAIEHLARRKGVTFTGSGIWDMSRIWSGILLLGPCTEVRSLQHSSLTDISVQLLDATQGRQLGVGLTLAEFERSGLSSSPAIRTYRTVPEHVLAACGYTITRTAERVEPILFEDDVECPKMGGLLRAGTCVGTRIVGEVQTREGVTGCCNVELRLFRPGDVEHMFWEVDGKPRTRIRVERDDSAHATAACLFNRIPDVLGARPGIVLVSELGPMRSTVLGRGVPPC